MTVALLYDSIALNHHTGSHPENARRLQAVTDRLKSEGLWEAVPRLEFEAVDRDLLETVHDPKYVRLLEEFAGHGGGALTADTIMSSGSFDAACHAAGAAVRGAEAVLDGEVGQSFTLMRPPGHHACRAAGMGFCLFNSVALAAVQLTQGRNTGRVMVVDFDVHHGNGTQELLYDDGRTLFISAHQHPAYPGTGMLNETGEGAGEGLTINIPLPPEVGDAGYERVFDEVIAPAARRYQPWIILVSAGFDAHWTNYRQLGSILMGVTVGGFAMMVGKLKALAEELCEGRLSLVLEGGYDLEALGWSVAATLRVLRGEEWDDPVGAAPHLGPEPDISALLAEVRSIHGLD